MCSASACEHYCCIEEWILTQRRNRFDQKLVETLVRSHTNLVLRESLDDTLRHLLPWDIELVIDEPVTSWWTRRGTRSFSVDCSTVTHTDLICSESRLVYHIRHISFTLYLVWSRWCCPFVVGMLFFGRWCVASGRRTGLNVSAA
jgi:hypothetical protein